jgi:orotate phosphoribosyltransferase
MDTTELRQHYVEGVYSTGSLLIRKEPFKLKSGKQSHVYLNHNNFLMRSEYLKLVSELYTHCVTSLVSDYSLGVVDSIMSPIIVGAMSVTSTADIVVVRSQAMQHGVQDSVFGELRGEVVLIDDMTSSGGTIIEATIKLRERGGVVRYAIVSASRDQSAREALKKHDITLISLLSFEQIFELLEPRLTEEERNLIMVERDLRSGE